MRHGAAVEEDDAVGKAFGGEEQVENRK